MKNVFKLFLVASLIITSTTLFAESPKDTSNINLEAQITYKETISYDYETKGKAISTLQKSIIALENIMQDPEIDIPQSLISNSEGIVIFPGTLKIALGTFGGLGGKGIAIIRMDDGSWSNPFFVSIGEGSVGCQLGIQKSDIVLFFKDKNDVLGIDKSEITVGADVAVAVGAASVGCMTSNDIKFDSEIYSFRQSKGLFIGASLKGGVLTTNIEYNESLYAWNDVNTENIFNEIAAPFNDNVNNLIIALNSYDN